MTVAETLAAAAQRGLPRLDAQLLLLAALGRQVHDRAWLLAHDGDPVPADRRAAFESSVAAWAEGVPVAYLIGRKEFHGLELSVDRRVLVPRPDTETLVDWALALLTGLAAPRVLDLGTGSGAVALAIAHARADAQVLAVDASAGALAVAQANAQRLEIGNVAFARSDWFEGVAGDFDLIVSNPPYVAEGDPHLAALRHEPPSALVSGPDGLADIRRIVAGARAHLRPGRWLLLEHGWQQARAVRALLAAAGLEGSDSRRDLGGIERVSGARAASADN